MAAERTKRRGRKDHKRGAFLVETEERKADSKKGTRAACFVFLSFGYCFRRQKERIESVEEEDMRFGLLF